MNCHAGEFPAAHLAVGKPSRFTRFPVSGDTWGVDKISKALRRELGDEAPSKNTVARVLARLGRMRRRRPKVRIWSIDGRPRVEVHGPNDLWTIDFKGWWRAQNGERCEPLTVRDAYRRKVLAVTLVESTRAEEVREVLTRLFQRYGLPVAIQSDNGAPFVCTRGRGGLSRVFAAPRAARHDSAAG